MMAHLTMPRPASYPGAAHEKAQKSVVRFCRLPGSRRNKNPLLRIPYRSYPCLWRLLTATGLTIPILTNPWPSGPTDTDTELRAAAQAVATMHSLTGGAT
jgi:hypothetical protein